MEPPRDRVWIVSVGAGVIAVSLFVVGLILWRMTGVTPYDCPSPGACGAVQHHRLHPTRAEAVWLVSAVFAFIAIASVLRPDSFRHLTPPGSRGSLETTYRQPNIDGARSPGTPNHLDPRQ